MSLLNSDNNEIRNFLQKEAFPSAIRNKDLRTASNIFKFYQTERSSELGDLIKNTFSGINFSPEHTSFLHEFAKKIICQFK